MIHPGDLCPIPARIDPEVLVPRGAAASPNGVLDADARLRLAWPGDCPCGSDTGAGPARAYDFQVLAPSTDPWPIEVAATSSSGVVALFSEHYFGRINARPDPRGALRKEQSCSGPGAECTGWPFHGVVLGAVAIGSTDQFLVASHVGDAVIGSEVTIFDASFSPTLLARLDFEPRSVRRSIDGTKIFMVGERALDEDRSTAGFVVCGGAPMNCEVIEPAVAVPPGVSAFIDVVELPNNVLLLGGDHGAIAYVLEEKVPCADSLDCTPDPFAPTSAGYRWRWSDPSGRGELTGYPPGVQDFKSFGVLGDTVYACTEDNTGVSSLVLSASPSAAALEASSPSQNSTVSWSVALAVFPQFSFCGESDFRPIPGPRLRLYMSGSSVAEFDTSGKALPSTAGVTDRGVPDRFLMWGATVPGWSVAQSWSDDAVYRRDDRSGDPSFQRIYRSDVTDLELARWSGTIAARGNDFWGFSLFGQVSIARENAGSWTTMTAALPTEAKFNKRVFAAFDPTTDRFALVGSTESSSITLGVISVARDLPSTATASFDQVGRFESVPVPPGLTSSFPWAIAPTGAGGFVVLTRDSVLLWLDPEASYVPRSIPIDWTDPSDPTSGPPTDCPSDLSLWGLDGSNGVVWAVGCQGALLRVTPTLAQRVADPVVQPDTMSARMTRPTLVASRALCPDVALVGADNPLASHPLHIEHGEIYQLARSSSLDPPPDVQEYAPDQKAQNWGTRVDRVIAIRGTAKDLMGVFGTATGKVRFSARTPGLVVPFADPGSTVQAPFYFIDTMLLGARNDSGVFLLATQQGDAVLAIPAQ
jgi:hypothetical protein